MQRPLARFILPFGWHLMSLFGLIIAAILFAWAWAPDQARTIGLAMTGVVFTASGIVALPLEFQLSSLVQWGSGVRFDRVDETAGWGAARAPRY